MSQLKHIEPHSVNCSSSKRFNLGQVLITSMVLERLLCDDVLLAIQRHQAGDWGEVGEEDQQENELSLKQGFRLFSIYQATNGTRFWIITESDRSLTCVVLPEEC